MKKLRCFYAAITLASAILALPAIAQVPQIINYQGKISVGATAFTGTGQFRFALVNDTGTTSYWSNDGTSNAGSQPTAAVSLPVVNGLYIAPLGDTSITNMLAVLPAVFNNSDVRLRVWFNNGTNGSQLLSPDQRITSVGYAMVADTAQKVSDGAITQSMLASSAAVPVGAVIAWWGTTSNIPSGFELCDGAAPTTVGATLTGSKPNLLGKFPRGSAVADVKTTPLTGGLDTVAASVTGGTAITIAQMPAHDHSPTSNGRTGNNDHSLAHTHQEYADASVAGTGWHVGRTSDGGTTLTSSVTSGASVNMDHYHTLLSQGSGQTHTHTTPSFDNRPAFLELLYIIRVK